MINDPVADMLTRIRNSLMIGQPTVEIPSSKLKLEIARIHPRITRECILSAHENDARIARARAKSHPRACSPHA